MRKRKRGGEDSWLGVLQLNRTETGRGCVCGYSPLPEVCVCVCVYGLCVWL